MRRGRLVMVVVALLFCPGGLARADAIDDLVRRVHWGEGARALVRDIGAGALVVSPPVDFGDAYAQLIMREVAVGGVPLIAFFQMDKSTGGLKRIQLERQRHGVTPMAYRGVLGGLEAEYGAPDLMCGVRPGPADGYQAAAERVWRRGGVVIRAIFRDTTIEAFEGCLYGDPAVFGPCGLTGQLLVRISPPAADAATCRPPARRSD